MSTNYNINWLSSVGQKPMMRLLITCAKDGVTVTYGKAAEFLQDELDIPNLSPRHMGHVAGSMMNSILEQEEWAPPLNVLLVRQANGLAGEGAESYVEDYFYNEGYNFEDNDEREKALGNAVRDVRAYDDWEGIYTQLFEGDTFQPVEGETKTPSGGGGLGGEAESKEHEYLKTFVADNPGKLSPKLAHAVTKPEHCLASGDKVDVLMHETDKGFDAVVEVKSVISLESDIRRGIFQCVKYKAVLEAEYRSVRTTPNVKAYLVTEKPLSAHLKGMAKVLDVKTCVIPVN